MTPYLYHAIVVSVHDGDTITVDVDLGFKVWQRGLKVRLYGINAPELASPSGKASAAWLQAQLTGQAILLETIKDKANIAQIEKYGRWLGIVYAHGKDVSINDTLVELSLAERKRY